MSIRGVVPAVAAGAQGAQEARLRHVAQEFEAILLTQVLMTMRGRGEERGLMGMGQADGVVRDLYDEELGRSLARAGGIGLAAILVAALRDRTRG